MKFKIAAVFALLVAMQSSVFAQGGGPTMQQRQAMINANNGTMQAAAAKTTADGDLEEAQGMGSYVAALNIPTYWSDAQVETFTNLITDGDDLVRTGQTYYDLGSYYQGKGNDNYAVANGFWGSGNFAAAYVYYNIASGYYYTYSEGANAKDQYNDAAAKYQAAYAAYQAAYMFWSANTPPPI